MNLPALVMSALKRVTHRTDTGSKIVGLEIAQEPHGPAWGLTVRVQLEDGERLNRHAWLYPKLRRVTYCGQVVPY